MTFWDTLLQLVGAKQPEMLSPLANPQQEVQKVQEAKSKKKSFFDSMFTTSVSGTGPAYNAQLPDINATGAATAPQTTAPEVLSASDTSSNWSQYGRPEANPYANTLQEVFGNKASQMEQVLKWGNPGPGTKYGKDYGGENLSYDALAEGRNTDGSIDRGLFQINSNTFADFMRRHGNEMQAVGINSFDDMFDPRKNALMAKLIEEEQGYGAWYGAPQELRGSF